MSKKLQQTLTGAMAAMMATGVVATPVMAATTDVDAIYKAAYTATQKALTAKTQAAVNEARTAIKALPANLDWAIGEFSKQVDTVQHPILVNILAAIKTAEKTPNQANVNAAKKAIPAELLPQWKNSYSSAVDKIQQDLINKTTEAVKLAETSRKAEDIKVAKDLVADLLTADSEGIKAVAKSLEVRVQGIYDLDITGVSISKTGVTVEFKVLTEDLHNVTIDVTDNKGKVVEVEVKPLLLKGETGYTFKMKTSLKNRPEGTWTVNGVKVNLDEVNLVDDAIDAKDAESLFKVLETSGLVDNLFDELANQNCYFTQLEKLNDEGKVKTLADVQKAVDLGNEEAGSTVKIADLVIASKNATLNKFTNLFNRTKLSRTNSDWISDYKKAITTDLYQSYLEFVEITLTDVQKSVDAVNTKNIKAAVDKANISLNGTDIQNALDLINSYYLVEKDDDAAQKEKDALLKQLNINLAIYNINEADTRTAIKAGFKSLETAVADKNEFNYEVLVNEDILQSYVDNNDGNYKTYGAVKTFIRKAEGLAVKAVVEDINKTSIKTTDNEMLIKLNTLGKTTAKLEDKDKRFDYSNVNANLIEEYRKANIASLADGKTANLTVETVNNDIVKTLFDYYKAEEMTLMEVLRSNKLGLGNVVETNKVSYEKHAEKLSEITDYTVLKTLVANINSLVILQNSKDIETVKNELIKVDTTGLFGKVAMTLNEGVAVQFTNLTNLAKTDAAEMLIALFGKDEVTLNKVSDIFTAVEKSASTAYKSVQTLNVEKLDKASAITALKTISPAFKALDAVKQDKVAEDFINNRPVKVIDANANKTELIPFNNFSEVRTLVAKVMK